MKSIIDLIYENQNVIRKISYSFCESKEDRDDLFQEIVYKILKSKTTFREESKFSTWLYKVALNTAITFKKKNEKSITLDKPGFGRIDFEKKQDEKEEIEILYKAINKLKKLNRVIILLYLEEKKHSEIAEITGLTEKNISVRIVRIKKKLGEIYETDSKGIIKLRLKRKRIVIIIFSLIALLGIILFILILKL